MILCVYIFMQFTISMFERRRGIFVLVDEDVVFFVVGGQFQDGVFMEFETHFEVERVLGSLCRLLAFSC